MNKLAQNQQGPTTAKERHVILDALRGLFSQAEGETRELVTRLIREKEEALIAAQQAAENPADAVVEPASDEATVPEATE